MSLTKNQIFSVALLETINKQFKVNKNTNAYQSGFKDGLFFACDILSGHAKEIIKDYGDVFELFKFKQSKLKCDRCNREIIEYSPQKSLCAFCFYDLECEFRNSEKYL